ncbi:MAG: hypothetical protein EBZ54_01735 [Actinobacteria bacterium]|nr:hypothetical protein [Actinomycetota bacterium]
MSAFAKAVSLGYRYVETDVHASRDGEVAMLRLRSWTKSQGRDLAPLAAQVPPRQGPLPIVDKRFVSHAHELGLHVHVWTIDDRSEMHELLDLGVDGIMTDSLATLASTLNERGQWS